MLLRNGMLRGLHSNAANKSDERPLYTVTASDHDGHLERWTWSTATGTADRSVPTISWRAIRRSTSVCRPEGIEMTNQLNSVFLYPGKRLDCHRGSSISCQITGRTSKYSTGRQAAHDYPLVTTQQRTTIGQVRSSAGLFRYADLQDVLCLMVVINQMPS
ncbi:hypothetical protein DVR14_09135 [Natrinema thermotolerans]|nr:hypothetical protein DVR14_09135 [Natrinema thermotolerans]